MTETKLKVKICGKGNLCYGITYDCFQHFLNDHKFEYAFTRKEKCGFDSPLEGSTIYTIICETEKQQKILLDEIKDQQKSIDKDEEVKENLKIVIRKCRK